MENPMLSRMKLERVKQEVSQTDLFIQTGIPQWRLSLVERGIVPNMDEAEKISSALGVSVRELFPIVHERQKNRGPIYEGHPN
jgi:hypothetical protein